MQTPAAGAVGVGGYNFPVIATTSANHGLTILRRQARDGAASGPTGHLEFTLQFGARSEAVEGDQANILWWHPNFAGQCIGQGSARRVSGDNNGAIGAGVDQRCETLQFAG